MEQSAYDGQQRRDEQAHEALEDLQRQIVAHERLAQIDKQASEALEEVIESKMRQQERRIARVAWGQGVVFAVFGATVTVLIVIFAHFLAVVR